MRKRIWRYAGPVPGGGFAVRVELPLAETKMDA